MNEYININTLFYAVIALAVLILIMIITFFVSVKPNLQASSAAPASYHPGGVDNTLAQIVSGEEAELVNNGELVAVITAAIYASMGDMVPEGGLVVRSIRKANTNRWRNA